MGWYSLIENDIPVLFSVWKGYMETGLCLYSCICYIYHDVDHLSECVKTRYHGVWKLKMYRQLCM